MSYVISMLKGETDAKLQNDLYRADQLTTDKAFEEFELIHNRKPTAKERKGILLAINGRLAEGFIKHSVAPKKAPDYKDI